MHRFTDKQTVSIAAAGCRLDRVAVELFPDFSRSRIQEWIRSGQLTVNGKKVSPLEITGQVLFPNWKMKQGETDITIFQSIIEGTKDGKKMKYTIDLYDKYDAETDVMSMARTTGYTATLTLRMIAEGIYSDKGISPPEYLGKYPECVDYLQKGLKKRGVNWEISEEVL